jgi:hypothetical protein
VDAAGRNGRDRPPEPADAGESRTMKLKTVTIDGKVYAEVQEDRPVYLADDGKEIAFDAPGTIANIGKLNGEAKANRERAEKAERDLKGFEGIADPEAARKALETVQNIKDGDLISAGKAEEIKAGARKAAEEAVEAAKKTHAEQMAALTGERDTLQTQLYAEKVGGAFGRSKFIADKVAVPTPMLEKTYGGNFKVEDGKLIPYDGNGSKIFSRVRPTEIAEFDEAIEILIAADPYKDHILKGTGANGSQARENQGGGNGKTMSRAEFTKLPPAEQMAKMTKEGITVVD